MYMLQLPSMRNIIVLKLLLCISGGILLLPSCTTTPQKPELKVAAAGSLTEVFQVLAQQFELQSGIRVIASFAATGQLAQQIRNGAPYDVFAAADAVHIDNLIGSGFLDTESRMVYAQGELVLIRPAQSALEIGSLPDLLHADIERIAIANPEHAPYGIAAREALQSAGLWHKLESKVIYGETVKQAAVIVATGNADTAIIARSVLDPSIEWVAAIPPRLHAPILHVAARVSASSNQEAANAFLKFLLSAEGQATLQEYGFAPP
jgi:molybdate transport system substrate-binding protein